MNKKKYICGASALFIVSLSHAQFVAYDGFETPGDYAANTNVSGQNALAGTGNWDGAWIETNSSGTDYETVTTSLSYSDSSGNQLVTSAGSLSKDGSNTIIQRDFAAEFASTFSSAGNSLWFSVLISMDADTDLFFRAATITSGNGPGFNIVDGNLSAEFNNTSSSDFALGSTGTFFILGRVQQDVGTGGDDLLEIWVNPDLGSAPSVAADVTAEQGFALGNGVGANIRSRNSSTLSLDELRLGSTFASVTPFTAVPEPNSYALLAGLMALCSLVVRRRR